MPEIVGDSEIGEMIAEAKYLPSDWQAQLADLKDKADSLEGEFSIVGTSGTRFRIIVSQSIHHQNKFTVILIAELGDGPDSEIKLLRYDGSNHAHRNKIEGNRIARREHIHRATERYQRLGSRFQDGYAEATDRYRDLGGAWECFWHDTNLAGLGGDQFSPLPDLFTEV